MSSVLDLPAVVSRPADFTEPDWTSPLDVDLHLAQVPAAATVKGMFFTSTLDDVRARGFEPPREDTYYAFRDYSMRDSLELLIDCARVSYPDHSLREGLRRLTRPAYSTFSETLIGRVVFGVVGRNPASIYRLAAKAWRHGASHGRLDPEIGDDNTAVVRVSDFYLTECAAVGIAEGVLEVCGARGTVALRRDGPTALQLWIHWS